MLAIASTFTAEPLLASLRFWQDRGLIDAETMFSVAPPGQIEQQLLGTDSLQSVGKSGWRVLMLRFADATEVNEAERYHATSERIAKTGIRVRGWIRAIRAAAENSTSPIIVVRCPDPPNMEYDDEWPTAQWEGELLDTCRSLSGVYAIPSDELERLYPVAEKALEYGDELGLVPYTPAFYAALGTVVARTVSALERTPLKVIALDADGTLWDGVCGEVGPAGIRLTEPHLALQQFMVNQRNQGALLALCSKNHGDDVAEVFDAHPAMPLCFSDFSAVRINWKAKSDNLMAMADELNVGLDSFLFVDDSVVETAEVRAHLPDVLALTLPEDPGQISPTLRGFWAFDRSNVTSADRDRATYYEQESRRNHERTRSLTLSEFLASLQLDVEFSEMHDEDAVRVAQLSQRTNQFTATSVRFTPEQLLREVRTGMEVFTVRVTDRFGDYGLVGAAMVRESESELVCTSLMLSCRALSRGVEHRIIAELGAIASGRNLSTLRVLFHESGRNEPMARFLETEFDLETVSGIEQVYSISADRASALIYDPDQDTGAIDNQAAISTRRSTLNRQEESERLSHIARNLQSVDQIVAAIFATDLAVDIGSRPQYVAPATSTENCLASIWQPILRIDNIGRSDNFFDLGGDSLAATIMLARAAAEVGARLPLSAVFETPTLAGLASTIVEYQLQSINEDELALLLSSVNTFPVRSHPAELVEVDERANDRP